MENYGWVTRPAKPLAPLQAQARFSNRLLLVELNKSYYRMAEPDSRTGVCSLVCTLGLCTTQQQRAEAWVGDRRGRRPCTP